MCAVSSFAKGFGGCLGVFGAICCVCVGGCVFMAFLASNVKINTTQNTQPPVIAEQADQKPNEPVEPAIPVQDPPALPKWSSRTSKDELTDAVIEISSLESMNTVDLSFPYQGEQRGRLTLRNTAGKYEVMFSIARGQLFPGSLVTGEAKATMRVDDLLVESRLSGTTGYQTETVFLLDERLPQLIMSGNELRIEAELYNEPNTVFVFDLTSGR